MTTTPLLPSECTACSICLEDLSPETPTTTTKCQHLFHEACLKTWVKKAPAAPTCPLCRTALADRVTRVQASPPYKEALIAVAMCLLALSLIILAIYSFLLFCVGMAVSLAGFAILCFRWTCSQGGN